MLHNIAVYCFFACKIGDFKLAGKNVSENKLLHDIFSVIQNLIDDSACVLQFYERTEQCLQYLDIIFKVLNFLLFTNIRAKTVCTPQRSNFVLYMN
jgi:hypothetical protein